VKRSLALAAASAVLGAVCGAGCGSGPGSGGGSASLGISGVSSSTNGQDLDPPEITITSPSRGAFLPSGPVTVTGRVTDVGSGVASLTIQGTPVKFGPTGDFSTQVRLEPGVAPIKISAVDKAGNHTDRTIGVETGDYLPAAQIVPGALAGRINASSFAVFEKIAAAEIAAIQSTIGAQLAAANPIFSKQFQVLGVTVADVDVSIANVSFGTPQLALASSAQGLDISVTIPTVQVDVTIADKTIGIPITVQGGFSADPVTAHALATLGMGPGGALDVQLSNVTTTFTGFHLTIGGFLSWLAPIAEPLLKGVIESQVAQLIQTNGADAIRKLVSQGASVAFGGATGTFSYALDAIATDPDGISFVCGVNLELTPDPSFPVSPGSLAAKPGLPTGYSKTPTLVFSISAAALNRALHAAWQSGLLAYDVIPSQVAQAFGTALPFGATGQDLASFFPSLRGKIPAADLARPIVYRIHSLLPPTATLVPGAPDPLRVRFGEYEVTARIDEGNGQFLDVFTVSMDAEMQVGVQISNGAAVPVMASLPNPPVQADLIASPLAPIGAAHLDGYLTSIIPMLFGGILKQLPPLPLPALPGGAQITTATFRADGPNASYLTIEAVIR